MHAQHTRVPIFVSAVYQLHTLYTYRIALGGVHLGEKTIHIDDKRLKKMGMLVENLDCF